MDTVSLVYKGTYHDTQSSYDWRPHITRENGTVLCGRNLNPLWWDQWEDVPLDRLVGLVCGNCYRSLAAAQHGVQPTADN